MENLGLWVVNPDSLKFKEFFLVEPLVNDIFAVRGPFRKEGKFFRLEPGSFVGETAVFPCAEISDGQVACIPICETKVLPVG